MKIDNYLLTEKDIKNIKLREQIDSEIQEKIQIEYDRISNECVEKYGNVNYEELKNSDMLKYNLIRKSRGNNEDGLATIFGIMLFFTPTVILYIRYINNKFTFNINEIIMCSGMYLISILVTWLSIKDIIEKRKIKKNFKTLGIGDEL